MPSQYIFHAQWSKTCTHSSLALHHRGLSPSQGRKSFYVWKLPVAYGRLVVLPRCTWCLKKHKEGHLGSSFTITTGKLYIAIYELKNNVKPNEKQTHFSFSVNMMSNFS